MNQKVNEAILEKRVVPSPTLQYSSYWKRSLRVTFDNDWPTYLQFFYDDDFGINWLDFFV